MSEKLRENSINLIKEYSKKAKEIEEPVFYNYGNNYNEYCNRIVKIVENLKSDYVKENIKNGTWKYEEFYKLEKDVLNPEKWQKLHDIRNPKSMIKERKKGITKCPRCKSWITIFNLKQVRSADEGMTQFNECLDCSFFWKTS